MRNCRRQSLRLQHTQLQQLQHDEKLKEVVLATTTHSVTTTTTWWETEGCSPCDYNTLSYNYNMMRNWRRQSLRLQHTLSYNNYNMMRNWRRQSLRLQHTLSYNNYNMMRNWRRQSLRLQHTQIQQLQHDEKLKTAVLATTTHSDTTTTTWWETEGGSPCDYNTLRYNNYNMMRNWRRQSLRLQHTQLQQLQHDEKLKAAVLVTTTHSVTTTTTWWETEGGSPCDYNIHSVTTTTWWETEGGSPCDYNTLRYNYNMMRNWRRQSLRLQHTQIQQLQHDEKLKEAVLATTTHSDTTTTTWWETEGGSPCNYNTLSYNYYMLMN